MKRNPLLRIAVIISLMITTYHTNAQQRIDAKLFVNHETREFVLFKPSGPVPSDGYPMVFMLHGSNQTGDQFYNISGWKEVAEREKFIVVFPTALVYCTTEGVQTKWSEGNTASLLCPGDTLKDDIPFFYKMIDTISGIIPIQKKKIYITGFSGGGTMTPKLTIKMPGVFAAAGCGSGNLDGLDSAAMNPKVPTWAIRGTHDHNFLDRFGRPCPFNDSALIINSNNLDNHLGSMGLSWKFKKDSNSYYINYTFTDALPGESPAFFRWSIFYGLEHEYFNGKNYLSNLSDPPIEAEFFWEFFKTVSNVTSTENSNKSFTVDVFPNPANDKMFVTLKDVTLESAVDILVYDLYGRLRLSQKSDLTHAMVLDKNVLGSGVYMLLIRDEKKILSKKIIFK